MNNIATGSGFSSVGYVCFSYKATGNYHSDSGA